MSSEDNSHEGMEDVVIENEIWVGDDIGMMDSAPKSYRYKLLNTDYNTQKEDLMKAMLRGPWTIMGHYLTMQLWTPDFRADTADMKYVIAKVDMNTQLANRGKFARVAVELNLLNPLIS
ncbi:conserved hypothetical protein [Ricinus communis]|uniref:DUF4283 domain-containing protein n=1 Tax=Ricinus communis TaxID=3988 RepID=B9SJS5_RICCO|nr:conserved hypothetical protein [Ricinus communis]